MIDHSDDRLCMDLVPFSYGLFMSYLHADVANVKNQPICCAAHCLAAISQDK